MYYVKFLIFILVSMMLSGCSGESNHGSSNSNNSDFKFISDSSVAVAENETKVLTVSVKSTYQVSMSIDSGDDASMFHLFPNGELFFTTKMDYESPQDSDKDNIYKLTVSATDSNGKKISQDITVTVTDVDESMINALAPHFITTDHISIPSGTINVMRIIATDTSSIFYALVTGLDSDRFYLNKYTGKLRFKKSAKHDNPTDTNSDNVYEITVKASNTQYYQSTQNIKITVTSQTVPPPVFDSSDTNIMYENHFKAHAIHATGNGDISYSIVGGDDSSAFSIDSSGGLYFTSMPSYQSPSDKNHDNVYEVDIRATDEADMYSTKHIKITVLQTGNDMIFTTSSDVVVDENTISVLQVHANGTGQIIYTLSIADDSSRFNINPNSGVLSFNQAPNYEAPADSNSDNIYKVSVKAIDETGREVVQDINIRVRDLQESSISITSKSVDSIKENRRRLFAVQASGGSGITYSISNTYDGLLFSIDEHSGDLSFKNSPDFENPQDTDNNNIYILEVRATNASGGSTKQTVQIRVLDNDELVVPLLIVRVQYSNYSFASPESKWSKMIFGNEQGELNNYYNEISNGSFRFTPASENYGTVSDGVVTVTLNQNLSGNSGNGDFRDRAKNALSLADSYVNFAQYDKDGNGKLSKQELEVLFISAGGENATNASPGVWAHQDAITDSWYNKFKLDNVRLINSSYGGTFVVVGEKFYDAHSGPDATMGIMAHELGHGVFALPDLYDTDGSSAGIGSFGLMGTGMYAYRQGQTLGATPTHMTGWSKIFCGFVQPVIVNSSVTNLAVENTASTHYSLYKIPSGNSGEYFLVENRANEGYDKGLNVLTGSGSFEGGLSILHIDDSKSNNSDDSHRKVDVEEANNPVLDHDNSMSSWGDKKNLFYDTNKDTFTPYTTPNSHRYNGSNSGISINNISSRGKIMHLDIEKN